jgi:hypothetical protein
MGCRGGAATGCQGDRGEQQGGGLRDLGFEVGAITGRQGRETRGGVFFLSVSW